MRRFLAIALLVAAAVVVTVALVARRVPLVGMFAAGAAILALPALFALFRDRAAALVIAIAAPVLAALLVVPTYVLAHPPLHVDNTTGAPLDLWIDGVRVATIAPTAEGEEPPRFRVAFGRRRLAWSAVGGPVGLHEIEVDVSPLDEHLYAPGGTGCYWLAVTAYGGASTHGIEHGPRPLTHFHRFDRVDVWFGDTPRRIDAPLVSRGAVRVALQRWNACMELAAMGCDSIQRAGFVECMRTIDGRAAGSDCWTEATKSCPAPRPANEPKP